MGERLELRAFKGPSELEFCAAMEKLASKNGGKVWWNSNPKAPKEDCRTSHNGHVHALYLPYLGGADYLFCKKLGQMLSVPWIELRVQEGSLWDYSLYLAGEYLNNFSTWPEYWDENDLEAIAAERGNPQLLAETWGIPLATIEKYLKPWGMKTNAEGNLEQALKGKAYPADEYEYGDIWQMYDLLRALGGLDPMNTYKDGRQHRFKCPNQEALKA